MLGFGLDGEEIVVTIRYIGSTAYLGCVGELHIKTGTAHMYYSFTRSRLTMNLFSQKRFNIKDCNE